MLGTRKPARKEFSLRKSSMIGRVRWLQREVLSAL
jgi:hypothetical protein